MSSGSFTFTAEVWEHQGNASWHFLSLPEEDLADGSTPDVALTVVLP